MTAVRWLPAGLEDGSVRDRQRSRAVKPAPKLIVDWPAATGPSITVVPGVAPCPDRQAKSERW